MALRELLEQKRRKVITIDGGDTVEDAIDVMAAGKVSALVVLENQRPAGIFAARDLLRTYLTNRQRPFSQIRLNDAMTSRLLTATADDSITSTMAVMLREDIRHLPVVDSQGVVGMLTLKDLIEHRLSALDAEINHLRQYIEDLHDAVHD